MITASNVKLWQTSEMVWEVTYPIVIGVAVVLLFLTISPHVFEYASREKIQITNAYGAVAGLFSIITGFLASFYGSIQAITDTRLRRVARTPFFRRFLFQIKEATIAGFILAIFSIPFIIIAPDNPVDSWFTRFFISLWCGFSAYALVAFVRVGRWLFVVFERQPPDYDGAG